MPLHFHMHACDPLKGRISVAFDGSLYPCHRFLGMESLSVGSVYDDELNQRVVDAFARFNRTPLNGCLAMLKPAVERDEAPQHSPDFIRMMEVTLAGSASMLDRGVRILGDWPPEQIPADAQRLMQAHSKWRAKTVAA
jgi:hypothetical protein